LFFVAPIRTPPLDISVISVSSVPSATSSPPRIIRRSFRDHPEKPPSMNGRFPRHPPTSTLSSLKCSPFYLYILFCYPFLLFHYFSKSPARLAFPSPPSLLPSEPPPPLRKQRREVPLVFIRRIVGPWLLLGHGF